KDAIARAVPGLDVARGVLDVKELAVAPQGALWIVCVTIYGRDLLTLRGSPSRREQARQEDANAWTNASKVLDTCVGSCVREHPARFACVDRSQCLCLSCQE